MNLCHNCNSGIYSTFFSVLIKFIKLQIEQLQILQLHRILALQGLHELKLVIFALEN